MGVKEEGKEKRRGGKTAQGRSGDRLRKNSLRRAVLKGGRRAKKIVCGKG